MAALHLEGEAHDWWFHGMTTLGLSGVTTYDDFTKRVLERFDRKDTEEHFVALTKLKQSENPETYISEFLRLSVMLLDFSEPRRIYMFIDGLVEPLRGLVRSTRPTTL